MAMTEVGKLSYDPNMTLGRGSFGTVFSGYYAHLDESFNPPRQVYSPVAVKRVDKSQVNESVIQKVQREVEIMKKASHHPNILNYIHTEMNNEFWYLV